MFKNIGNIESLSYYDVDGIFKDNQTIAQTFITTASLLLKSKTRARPFEVDNKEEAGSSS